MKTNGRTWLTGMLAIATSVGLMTGGCENAGQGAVSGAAVGSLSGLAIGSLTGSAGKGAAIGAIAGGLGGAVIGDQNRRRSEAEHAQADYKATPALSGLVGNWNVKGSAVDADGKSIAVEGTATAFAEKKYFLKIDVSVKDPRSGEMIEGMSVVGQEGGHKVSMTNSFSSVPETRRFEGEMDASGSIITLRQVSPPRDRKVIVRIGSNDRWAAEAWEGSKRTENLEFSRR